MQPQATTHLPRPRFPSTPLSTPHPRTAATTASPTAAATASPTAAATASLTATTTASLTAAATASLTAFTTASLSATTTTSPTAFTTASLTAFTTTSPTAITASTRPRATPSVAPTPRLRAPIGWHVTMRLDDDRVIAPTRAARRIAARVVLRQGAARGQVAFGLADNHLHAVLLGPRDGAGQFARYVESALQFRLRLAAPFSPARIRPIVDQRHLERSFFYVLRQRERHGLHADRTHDGTALPDLLGLRVVDPSLRARVAEHLPRLSRGDLWPLLIDRPDGPDHPSLFTPRLDGPWLADLADAAAARLVALPA